MKLIRPNICTVLVSTTTLGLALAVMTAAKPPSQAPLLRFVDNLDGTISDKSTGLMWEKKTPCQDANEKDPHCVNNSYEWSQSGNSPDGSLFKDFLAKLNQADGGKNYKDWRIPSIDELKTILGCPQENCIDPIFGPTQASRYWSSTPYADFPDQAWTVNFFNGAVNFRINKNGLYARAVRGR
jgi:hypothetical protein